MRWFARDLWRQGEVDMQRDHNLRHKGTAPNPHSAQYGNFLFQKSWRKVVGGSSRGSCQYQVCKQLTCPWLYQLDAQTPQTTDLYSAPKSTVYICAGKDTTEARRNRQLSALKTATHTGG